ncbi:MAG: FGGY family carbohydrate kinase [Anaerolineae bacterium]|nr:FGGY family carbohydrate kinase [Thermoflexales bacterium]MDW8394968.1 FGGY family carbohydrate kinase [Anaerolineae bacterium]
MVESPLLAGIDVGTTNLKVVIFDCAGRVVAHAHRPTPTHYPRPDWAFYEPEEIWNTLVEAIRTAVAQIEHPERILGIACSSMGEAGVPIDAQGSPLYHAIAWFDRRTEPQAELLAQTLGRERVIAVTGLDLYPIYGICKLRWLRDNEPETFARTDKWLNMGDYVAYRLCGVPATDYSLASRMLMMNLRQLCWDVPLITDAGLRPSMLASLLPSGTALGKVRAEVAEQTGLPLHTVVATGGQDHICAAFALGVVQPGTALDSIGSAEALFFPISAVIDDPVLARMGYAQGAHVAGGYYILGGQFAAGVSVEWFRHLLAENADYATLVESAAKIPIGSHGVVFLPHLRTANTPHNDPLAMGALVGLTAEVNRAAVFRAILEGLCFEMRSMLEPLLRAGHVPQATQIIATGGGARNSLMMQIKAEVFRQPITIVDVAESAALGAAMLAGIAAGVYEDAHKAISAVCSSLHTQQIEPMPLGIERYERLYTEVYQHLYAALRPVHHAIRAVQAS